MESILQQEEIDCDRMNEILKRSEAGEIPPPKSSFFGLIHRCPQCNNRVKSRCFKEVWRISGRFAFFFQAFECTNCDWKYVKRLKS